MRDRVSPALIQDELHYAATHRSEFMWPWEEEPISIATGILDDETYDWLAVVEGMLLTGGVPLVVDEQTLGESTRSSPRAHLCGCRPHWHLGSGRTAGAAAPKSDPARRDSWRPLDGCREIGSFRHILPGSF